MYYYPQLLRGLEPNQIRKEEIKKIIKFWSQERVTLLFPFESPPVVIRGENSPYKMYTVLSISREPSQIGGSYIKVTWYHSFNMAVREPPQLNQFLVQLNMMFLTHMEDERAFETRKILIPLEEINGANYGEWSATMDDRELCIITSNDMLNLIMAKEAGKNDYDRKDISNAWPPFLIQKSLLRYQYSSFYIRPYIEVIRATHVPFLFAADYHNTGDDDAFLMITTPNFKIKVYLYRKSLAYDEDSGDEEEEDEEEEEEGEKPHKIYLHWKKGQYAYDLHCIAESLSQKPLEIRRYMNSCIFAIKSIKQNCNLMWKLDIIRKRTERIQMTRLWAIRMAIKKLGEDAESNQILSEAATIVREYMKEEGDAYNLELLFDREYDEKLAKKIEETYRNVVFLKKTSL
jgi:hypothetical protein